MDFLKKFWPFSFKNNDCVKNLVIGVILYVVAAIVAGVIIGISAVLLAPLGAVGAIISIPLSLIGYVIELYVTAGIVFKFLAYFKVFK